MEVCPTDADFDECAAFVDELFETGVFGDDADFFAEAFDDFFELEEEEDDDVSEEAEEAEDCAPSDCA